MDVKNRWTVWILVSSFMCTSNNICSAQLCSELCLESPTSRFDIESGSRISGNDLADSGPSRSNSSGMFVQLRRSNKGFSNFFADYLEEKRAIKSGHRKSDQKVNTFVRIGKFLRSRERIPSTFVRIGRDKTTRMKDRIPNTFVRIGKQLSKSKDRVPSTFVRIGRHLLENEDQVPGSFVRVRRSISKSKLPNTFVRNGRQGVSKKKDRTPSTFVRIGRLSVSKKKDRTPSSFVRIGRQDISKKKDRTPSTFVRIGKESLSKRRDRAPSTLVRIGKATSGLDDPNIGATDDYDELRRASSKRKDRTPSTFVRIGKAELDEPNTDAKDNYDELRRAITKRKDRAPSTFVRIGKAASELDEPSTDGKDDYEELKQASDSARTGKQTEDADEIKDDGLYDESGHLDSDHPDAAENWMRSIRSGHSSPYRKLLLYKKYSSKLQKNRGALHSSSFVRIGKDNNESAIDDEAGDLGSKEGVATDGDDDDDGTSSGEVLTNYDGIPVEISPDSAGSIDALDKNRGLLQSLEGRKDEEVDTRFT